MDLYQLNCFRTVAQMEHISNAAAVLHVTQPALSKIISRVEDYAGVPLFDRVKGKIRLNAAGMAFLDTVDGMFDIMEKGKKRAAEVSAKENNQIRLAASSDSILFILAETFFSRHPEVRIRYTVMSHEQIREVFMRNGLDFALTTYALQEKGVEWERIGEEEIYMLVSKDSPFYDRKEVAFSELRNVEIMCENSGGDLREVIDRCCEAAGFTPNVVLESTHGAIMGFSYGLSRAVSFVPAHRFMQMCESPIGEKRGNLPVRAVRLSMPSCTWVTGIARMANQPLSPAAENFDEITRDYFTKLYARLDAFSKEYFGD
jgi:DNA-binding transcriptional LysR family regulator